MKKRKKRKPKPPRRGRDSAAAPAGPCAPAPGAAAAALTSAVPSFTDCQPLTARRLGPTPAAEPAPATQGQPLGNFRDFRSLADELNSRRAAEPEKWLEEEKRKEAEQLRLRAHVQEKQRVRLTDLLRANQELEAWKKRSDELDHLLQETEEEVEALRRKVALLERTARLAGEYTPERIADLEAENRRLRSRVEQVTSGRVKAEDPVRRLLGQLLPNIDFLDGSVEAMLNEVTDLTGLMQILKELNAGSAVKGERVHQAPAFIERRFNAGRDRDRGRVYFSNGTGKPRVLVTVKKDDQDQRRDIERLCRTQGQ